MRRTTTTIITVSAACVAAATAWADQRPPLEHQTLAWKIPAPPAFARWSTPLVLAGTFVGFYDEGRRDPVICARVSDGQVTGLVRRLPPELSHGGMVGTQHVVAVAA